MSAALPIAAATWLFAVFLTPQPRAAAPQVTGPPTPIPAPHAGALFMTSHDCLACHNGLTTPTGEDASIGVSWRASIMANSSRDPYWQAAVRRETIDHPSAAHAIEDECSICHMPMSRTTARAAGQAGRA